MAQSKKRTKRAATASVKRKTKATKAPARPSRAKAKTRVKPAQKRVAPPPSGLARLRSLGLQYWRWLQTAGKREVSLTSETTIAIIAFVVLLATTIYWAVLSARLQGINADQLVDSYLFQSAHTFHLAIFPGAHSFLLKWPIFWLMHLFGYGSGSYVWATVGLTVATILGLVAVLFCLLRRQLLLFATLCLALASVLLLIPAQPTAGALLPVNLAMTTTRNIEYLFFLASVYAFIKSRSLRDKWFGLGLVLALVLLASDKLFAPLFVGGALLGLALQILVRRRRPQSLANNGNWLGGSILAVLAASALLKLITRFHITTIANSVAASPYPIVHSVKSVLEACVFGLGSLLTNFGANPVHGVLVIKDIPSALLHSFGINSVAYAINALVLLLGLWSLARLVRSHYRYATDDVSTRFALALGYASVAALAVYLLTDHYYPVDARYITISLFAVFIATAVDLRQRAVPARLLLNVSGVLLIGIIIGLFVADHAYQQGKTALNDRTQLNRYLVDRMAQYNVGTLIGNYWYVTPIKSASRRPLTIVPMSDCRTTQSFLTSKAWLEAPQHQAVAYLAIGDSNGNSYDGCTQSELIGRYGVPTHRLVVSGSSMQPSQLLLIYSNGVKSLLKNSHYAPPKLPAPKAAPLVTALTKTNKCLDGSTLNVVAHEDDDLLFMNPDLLRDIRDKRCVTTVYLTAGDSGFNGAYVVDRQQGAEAAYSFMYNLPDAWQQRAVTVNGHQMTVAYLDGTPNVTLLFLNLPDGGMHGAGFARTNKETLSDLRDGRISILHSEDGVSAYSYNDLAGTLTSIMELYQPGEVHTQDYNSNLADGDHSDHHAAGYFTKVAYKSYSRPSVLRVYAGYPVRFFEPNVDGQDLADKEAIFLQYAAHDPAVCHDIVECQTATAYGEYLTHQYSKLYDAHVEPE